MQNFPANKYTKTNYKLNITQKKVLKTARKEKLFMLHNVPSKKFCILDIQKNKERFSKHLYGIKNGPGISKLVIVKHIHEHHNINTNLNVTILQNDIKTASAQGYHEDRWICRLKTLPSNELNTELVIMPNKCIICTNPVTNSVISFDIMLVV